MGRRWSILVLAIVMLVGILEIRAWRYSTTQAGPEDTTDPIRFPTDAAALSRHLAEAIRFPTITGDDAAVDAFRAYLKTTFPEIHARLDCEVVNGHSLLFTWRGTDPSLPPAALLAHLDVMPADASAWRQPPFEGRIAEGFLWGRGTLDDKGAVLGILEAVTGLLDRGFQPRRTLYLAFGHDEETGGHAGAAAIASLLASRGVKLDSVLDEGEVVGEGLVPGIHQPIAFIGTAEKGYLSLSLTTRGPGGHSSMPAPGDPILRLSKALARLEADPFPARFTEPVDGMFRALAPRMGHLQRLALANRWLFSPLLGRMLSSSAATEALIRTTAAPTVIEGGSVENALPRRARAVVNLRILPGETVEGTLARVRASVADPAVDIAPLPESALEPSPISPEDDPAYAALAGAIHEAFPDALVAPSLVLGGTDSAHYAPLARTTYRFLPARVGPQDLDRFHGNDERITVDGCVTAVRFYAAYLQRAGLPTAASPTTRN
ncbi:MAG TPA: M20 family peptidase [Holophagaceae bacterium]|nr:M20 family peptidase [Holophagaceae bacterium]